MPKQNETGHAINVANFEDLISFCTGYGAPYNPSKVTLSLPELDNKHMQAKATMDAINSALPANTNAINAREQVFAPLTNLVTRIPYAVTASDAPANAVADVKHWYANCRASGPLLKKPTTLLPRQMNQQQVFQHRN